MFLNVLEEKPTKSVFFLDLKPRMKMRKNFFKTFDIVFI